MNKTVPPKGVRLWQLERGLRNIKQANKRYSIKGGHTKEFLRMALELDYKIKNSTTGKFVVGQKRVFSPIYAKLCF